MSHIGKLVYHPESGKFIILYKDGQELPLSCGDVVALGIAGHWVQTGIEHHGQVGYFATTPGVKLQAGLTAALPEDVFADPLIQKLRDSLRGPQ